jgi:hypothetical protein
MKRSGGTKAPFSISGTVQVFCVHGQEKRSRTIMEFDAAEHAPNICVCCENMFLTPISEPLPIHCDECHPKNWEKKNG